MTKRKILAAATVTAIPLFLGSTQALSRPSAGPAPTTHTRHVAGQTAGPQWAWAIGMEGSDSISFGWHAAIEYGLGSPVDALNWGIVSAL